MDIKKMIENLVEKIQKDKNIAAKFEKEPVKVIEDIIGKSVIIHSPSGNAFPEDGAENSRKIACGIILSAG